MTLTSARSTTSCPCLSGKLYQDCCEPLHLGKMAAPTPEALMRSRFSAFCLKLSQYLLTSWAEKTRPPSIEFDDSVQWGLLEILDHSTASPTQGQVHFKAYYCVHQQWFCLEERSDFLLNEAGCWQYLQGATNTERVKPKRNERCPCGSAKKYKACCYKTS